MLGDVAISLSSPIIPFVSGVLFTSLVFLILMPSFLQASKQKAILLHYLGRKKECICYLTVFLQLSLSITSLPSWNKSSGCPEPVGFSSSALRELIANHSRICSFLSGNFYSSVFPYTFPILLTWGMPKWGVGRGQAKQLREVGDPPERSPFLFLMEHSDVTFSIQIQNSPNI